ncbi:oxidoreductase [Pilaira anomala]|nr:oxidoreductase [Pilaira anomala]
MNIKDYSEKVPGLYVVYDAVSVQEEKDLVEFADSQTWSGLGISPNPELKRRTQQYGHLFSYRYRKVLEEYGPFPDPVHFMVNRIMENNWMPNHPNHLLINEYNAGQGIMPHIDAPALFGPVIISLSLLSDCIMRFTCEDQSIDILLPRRSLAILTLDARYKYKHSISKDLEETVDGILIHRDRRVSFTFREIIAWEV